MESVIQESRSCLMEKKERALVITCRTLSSRKYEHLSLITPLKKEANSITTEDEHTSFQKCDFKLFIFTVCCGLSLCTITKLVSTHTYIADTDLQNSPRRNKLVQVQHSASPNMYQFSLQFSCLNFRCGINTKPEFPLGYEKAYALSYTLLHSAPGSTYCSHVPFL